MAQLFSQYKQMFDNMVEGAFFQGADGALFDVNPAALEMFGLSRDQFMGRTSYHPEWRVFDERGEPLAPEQHPSMVALRTGSQIRNFIAGVYNPLRRDTVWLEITATPLYQEGETSPCQVFVTLHDITRRRRGESALKESEEKFAAAFNLSPALMSISTLDDGRYIDVNDCFCQISGFDRRDVIGRTSIELGWIPAAKREEMKAILQRDGQISDVELELKRRDGAIITVLYSAAFITIAGQKRLLSIALDITVRRKAEVALKASEERYQAIVNTQTEFVDRYLPGGILTFVNEALCRYWGIRPADLIGKSFYPFLQEDDLQLLLARLAALTPEQPCTDVENRVNFHDGTVHWHSWTHHAIFDQDGTVIEYQSVGRDITSQRMAEEAKRISEQMSRAILSSTNDLILFISLDGTILLANEAVAERFGQTVDSFVGTNIFPYFPEDIRRLRQEKLAKAMQTRSPVRYEDDRAGRHFDNCLYPVIGADRTVTGVAIFSRDISERKQHETALKKAKNELETRVDERTASLAKANEQIRQMTFQLLKAEEQERMRIAAELHDQVGQSLLLAKMKVDALASDTATDINDNNSADISRLLEECIQDIRSLTFAMRPPLLDTAGFESALQWLCKSMYEDYRVKIDFSTHCQSIQLNSEHRYSLYQAVRELLLNVVKHAGVTHAELSLKTAGSDLIIRVSDKGSGFDTKAEPCTSAAGLGFGLFNVSQRLHLLGGCCHLESESGKGTIVTLTIPMGE